MIQSQRKPTGCLSRLLGRKPGLEAARAAVVENDQLEEVNKAAAKKGVPVAARKRKKRGATRGGAASGAPRTGPSAAMGPPTGGALAGGRDGPPKVAPIES